LLSLEAQGLSDVILPFLLIFSVMFAILSSIGLFGKKGESAKYKNINMFLSLAIAAMVVVPHVTNNYPPGGDVVTMINTAIPNVSAFVIAIVMFLILLGIFGIRFTGKGQSGKAVVTFLAMIVILLIFGSSAGWFNYGLPGWLSFLNDPDVQAIIVVILMFWVVISMITGTGEKKFWKDTGGPFFKDNFDNTYN